MNNNKLSKYIYLSLFGILYISVATVSTLHAISLFELANTPVLATLLAVTFEVGQAATLFSILTNTSSRVSKTPWVLMVVLTLVQILGNVYSSYRYMVMNSMDDLVYFKEPVFIWATEVPDAQTTVILTYIIGAILPICALALTGMVTKYLEDNKTDANNTDVKNANAINNIIEEPTHEPIIDDDIVSEPVPEPIKVEPTIEPKSSHFINM